MNIYKTAKEYAISKHKEVNHKYGDLEYSHHLEMVLFFATKYKSLIPYKDRDNVFAACWCHDLIEDARISYGDLKKATNKNVAEIVYAVTTEKGRTREERANDKYYEGINKTKYATFVKLCDRLANALHSKNTNSSMLKKYEKENDNFFIKLYNQEYHSMFVELKNLFK